MIPLVFSVTQLLYFVGAENYMPNKTQNEVCNAGFLGVDTCIDFSFYSAKECCKLCGGPSKPHRYLHGRCIYDPFLDYTSTKNESDESLDKFFTQKAFWSLKDCCEFCGYIIGDYKYHEQIGECRPITNRLLTTTFYQNELGFSPICLACKGFVGVLNAVKSKSIKAAKSQLNVYCEFSFLLRETCRNFIENQLDAFLRNATSIVDTDYICYDLMHVCETRNKALYSPSQLAMTLTAPRSRTTILDEGDGPILPQGSILQMTS